MCEFKESGTESPHCVNLNLTNFDFDMFNEQYKNGI